MSCTATRRKKGNNKSLVSLVNLIENKNNSHSKEDPQEKQDNLLIPYIFELPHKSNHKTEKSTTD